jgi:DNA mismatch repair protein MutS2
VQVTRVAGTPSHMAPVASLATLEQLGFERALALVAEHAVSELGGSEVRRRRPVSETDLIRDELATVGELLAVFHAGGRFAPRGVGDLTPVLRDLETAGSVLDAAALLAVADAVVAMRETRAGLEALSADAPLVHRLSVDVPPARLSEAIGRAIERDGRVKDGASPALKRARSRLRSVRERLVALLERLQHVTGAGDGGVTLRGGRYVIPVRREARGSVRGIVHGESASGATLFVEPAETVEHGNELNACEAEEAREVLAVLRDLTEQCRGERDRLAAGWTMCLRADDLYARTRYALETGAAVPHVREAPGPLSIRRGLHPLILADAAEPVPFDLVLEGDRTVVVSGPNAGGKTVLLKAVGLTAALVQSGIVPPLGASSMVPVFRRIFADIGDHQSIEASLSTFSAHVAALRTILDEADDTSLVLLDELGGGTDPLEGAALAQGVLLSLHERRTVTVATTHLGELKELASRTDAMLNASLEFDAETLAPTYRFLPGKPGRSYALAIARRHGLPDRVLAAAESLTPEAARTLEATLAELERREAVLTRREGEVLDLEARLERDGATLADEREDIERRTAELREREREHERAGRQQARQFLLDARKRVEEALAVARAAVSEATAKEARRLVEEGVREEGDALAQLERAARAKGWTVKGRGHQGGDSPRVRDLPERERGAATPSRPATHEALTTAAATEVDLRGMRVDEAEAALALAIDDAVVADLPALRIIHGKGTGALRSAVQGMLRADRRVSAFRMAVPQEGGAGVTVAELR